MRKEEFTREQQEQEEEQYYLPGFKTEEDFEDYVYLHEPEWAHWDEDGNETYW